MITYTCDRCHADIQDSRDVWEPEFKRFEPRGNEYPKWPVPLRDSIWHVCDKCVQSFFRSLPMAKDSS